MRVLVMYITDVSGHRSAALALEKALHAVSPSCQVTSINAFKYTNPISEKIVNRLYTTVIKNTPRIWDYMYDNPRVKKKLDAFKRFVHRNNSPKLLKLFDQLQPDVVVCTQAFPCGMVADCKKWKQLKLPLVGVLTDFVPHSYWIYDQVDYYITPAKEVSVRLRNKGVPEHKIRAFGIPFNPDFNVPVDKAAVRRQLGFSSDTRTILIMGGGQGLGPIKTVVSSLERVKQPLQEIIVTGTNKKLFKQLKKRTAASRHRVSLHGYVNNVNELMAVSDIIVSKPGGITTAEAMAKGLPMIIIRPLPGQEMNNTQFLLNQQAALRLDNPRRIQETVEELLNEPEKLSALSSAASSVGRPDSALDAARFILRIT